MAVQGPWVGSSAVAETGQRWMSTARTVVRLPGAGWLSEMIGKSKEITLELTANHNFDKNWLIDRMRERGSTPIVINVRGDLVSNSASVPLFEFPGDLANEYVQLNIHGVTIYGRGGMGAGQQNNMAAQQGGPCIHNWIGGRLRINNGGAIAGGGGGGGCTFHWNSRQTSSGGGGGRPFGAGGERYPSIDARFTGRPGTLSAPGAPGDVFESSRRSGQGGGGGDVAGTGGAAWGNLSGWTNTGGAGGGAALAGQAATWQAWGSVYGSTV